MTLDRREQPTGTINGDRRVVGSRFVTLSEHQPELNGDIIGDN